MSHCSSSNNTHTELDQIIGDYLVSLERGEPVSFQQLIHQHPRFVRELQEFAENNRRLQSAFSLWRIDRVPGAEPLASTHNSEASELGESYDTAKASIDELRFGEYRLIRKLGCGGMGVVFEALQPGLNRRVALKIASSLDDSTTEDIARLKFEAEAAAQLDHAHIVPVFDTGQKDGRYYIVMKLIDGTDLKRLPIGSAHDEIERMVKIVRAVQYAHDQGILHRDLKPSNILIDSGGEPYVTDFGLAKRIGAVQGLTRSSTSLGTPQYMSPEQASGLKNLTVASDIYSLGAILFERLCGEPLYDGGGWLVMMRKLQAGPIPKLDRLLVACDRELQTIIRKCTEFHVHDRYASCRDLAADLERWLCGEPISSRSLGRVERSYRWIRLHPWHSAAVALITICLFVCVLLAVANLESRWRRQFVEYARLVEQARLETVEHRPGWKTRALAAIDEAESLSHSPEDRRELCSLRGNCGLGFDVSEPRFSLEFTNARVVRFHPSQPWLFLAGKYGADEKSPCQILIADTRTGDVVRTLFLRDEHESKRNGIVDMAITADGLWLSVATRSSNILVYSLTDLTVADPVASIPTRMVHIWQMAAVEGKDAVVVAGHNGEGTWRLMSIDTKTWTEVKSRDWYGGISSVTSAPDIDAIIACGPSELAVVDPLSLEPTYTMSIPVAGNIAYHAGRVAVAGRSEVSIYGLATSALIGRLMPPPTGFATSHWDSEIAFSARGDLLVMGDKEHGQIHFWSSTDLRHIQSLPVESTTYKAVHFAISRDQRLFSATGGATATVSNVRSSELSPLFAGTGEVLQFAAAQDGRTLAVLADAARIPHQAEIRIHDLALPNQTAPTRKIVVNNIPGYSYPALRISRDGKRLALAIERLPFRTHIVTMDCGTLTQLGESRELSRFREFAFDPRGDLIVTADSGLVGLNEDATEARRHWARRADDLAKGAGIKFPVVLQITEDRVVLGDEDGWLTTVEWTDRPRTLAVARLGNSPLRAAAYHRPTRRLAVGDGDGTLFIVDAECSQLVHKQPAAHWSGISALVWTPSGELVSCGLDQRLHCWTWDAEQNCLDSELKLCLPGNVRQLFLETDSAASGSQIGLILRREGAYAVERLRIPRELLAVTD
ncbi:MAG: WD40 repeat domain-containing serine/threonine protein kinase [Pirellulaceae bacterium]